MAKKAHNIVDIPELGATACTNLSTFFQVLDSVFFPWTIIQTMG